MVRVEGHALTFFLDTGASFSVVTPSFLETADARRRQAKGADRAVGAHGTRDPSSAS
jgi:predicted aspartyl protease